MFPNQLQQLLRRHWKDPKLRKKSIFIEGPSGIGKSEIVKALAQEMGVELRDKRLSQMDAVDLGGTPWNHEGFTRWAPPDWMRFDVDEGILNMDEITSASREVFAASYQLFLDRALNSAAVPPGWMILACGNRVSDRGVINQMPAPLLNRFVKVTADPHLGSWLDEMARRNIDSRIMAWITHQPQYLHNFSSEMASQSEPFCSPRSLVSAADYLDWQEAERVEMLRGCLGKEGASALESFLRLYTRLPSRAEVEADPLGCRIPGADELGERYAMAMMCSAAMDRKSFDPMWRYVDRMGAQFVVLATRLAMQRDVSLSTAKGYRDFTSKHSAVFARV